MLGIDKVTVVGHSFGGGVAMQFAYQFPERTQRVMLVSTGGLGPEVTPMIRLIQVPGWFRAVGLLTLPGIRQVETFALRTASGRLTFGPLRKYTRDLDEVADIVESWKDRRTRFAIRHLVRAVIDWRGQIVTMADRAYLSEAMPMAVLWGVEDQVIPATHAENARALAPDVRVDVLADAGHFPHKDHPDEFVRLLDDFISTTEPASYNRARFRRMLKAGATAPLGPLAAVAAAPDGAAAERWLTELRGVRPVITGDDLLAAGVAPGPALGEGLAAARDAVLDGVVGPGEREAQLRVALEAAC